MDKNILIVDDEKSNLELVCQSVEDDGFVVHCATGVEEAFSIFEAIDPFMVLTDLRLKNHVDGATMADRMHRQQPLCIFVAISGYIDAFQLGYLLGAVFTDILSKPFDAGDLERIVNYAWEKRLRWEVLLNE